MERVRAAAIHLAISLLVVGSIAAVVTALWFPPAYGDLLHGYTLLMYMLAIDVAAGPLLTLVVYDRRKPSLKLDLSLISFAQAAFLVYGLMAASGARPVFLVAVVDRFHLVTAREIAAEDLAAAENTGYGRLSWTGPRVVGAELPEDPEARDQLLWEALEGRDIHLQPRHFVPWERVAPAVIERGVALVERLERNAAVRSAMEDASPASEDVHVLMMLAPKGAGAAAVDPRTLAVLPTSAIRFD